MHYCTVVRGLQVLRAKRANLDATAEDGFFERFVGRRGRDLQKYCLALHLRGVVSFLSLAPGQVHTRWSGSEKISFDLSQDPENWNWMTSIQGHIHLVAFSALWGNFSGSCPSGERPQIEGMFDGGCQVWEQTRAQADCFQLFVKFGLEVKDGKGPSPLFCLNGILLYQLLLEAWPDSPQCFAKLLFLSK